MSHLAVLICRIEDENQPEQLTRLQRIDLPVVEVDQLQPETALDALESQTLAAGQEVMRQLLLREWEAVDRQLVENYQLLFPPGSGRARWVPATESGHPSGDAPPAAPGLLPP